MIFLVIFIFGAVILGAGVMLSPAWITSQPRIALAGTLALALVIGGAVFWAYLFGWDTLVVDYMLFALVVGIFLGGTLSIGQSRAEKKGEVLLDEEQGWTGPEDLLFFAIIALIFAIPVIFFSVPFGNPLYAYMAAAAKLGGTFNTFAPFEPGVSYAYPPGFSAISAYLSHQLNVSVQTVQAGVGAVVGFMCVWLIYDFGSEIQHKRLGRAMAVAMLLGLGLLNTYFRADFTALLGILFSLAFLTYAYRYHREGYLVDLVGAGLLLGATLLVHQNIFIMTLVAYYLWLLISNLGDEKPPVRRQTIMAIAVPVITIIATSPYLLGGKGSNSLEFARLLYPSYIASVGDILSYHGIWIWIVAGIGLYLGLRERQQMTLIALSLLITALIGYQLNAASYLIILPLTMLGGKGLLWLWEEVILNRVPVLKANRWNALGAIVVMIVLWAASSALFLRETFTHSQSITPEYLAALEWLRVNTDVNDFVVQDGEFVYWTPIISERRGDGLYNIYVSTGIQLGTGGPMDYLITQDEDSQWTKYPVVFESGTVRVYQLKESAS